MDKPAESSAEENLDLSALPWIVWGELQRDAITFEYGDGIEDALSDTYPEFAEKWKELRNAIPDLTFERTFFTLSPGELAELVERQHAADTQHGAVAPVALEELFAHYFVRASSGEQAVYVAEALQGLEHIFARVQIQVPLPRQPANSQPYLGGVDPINNTAGIDVHPAWTEAGGNGENVVIGVIEQSWALTHHDLQISITPVRYPQVQPASNSTLQARLAHAIADVGILAAAHNGVAIDGIAAATTIRLASSIRTKNGKPLHNVADAITAITPQLPGGAVLLVEEQAETLWQGRIQLTPVEQLTAVHVAMRLAVTIGIAVIEPAGNEGIDIDALPTAGDSGAIIVGACADDGQHPSRLAGVVRSNFGQRVDCFALGEFVETLDVGQSTRSDYGGTSSASAIIAGAAAIVLSVAVAAGRPVRPEELRNWFRDAQWGVASANPSVDLIGVMPDVGRLVAML